MRYTRLIIGLLAVVFALWIIIGEQMSGASADAVVNAPVVTVRAPVAGNLRIQPRQLGSTVSRGEVIASIEDLLVDRVRLDDLLMELRLAEAAHGQLTALLQETETIREQLLARGSVFREQRLAELRTRLDHAERRLAIIESAETEADLDQQALDELADDMERLPAEPRNLALLKDHAQERVAVLRIALQAARQGVYLGDGYNDAPNAEQRAAELASEIALLTTQLIEAEARRDAIQERINRERLRVNTFAGGEILSPVNGIFWEILEADQVNVQRGDPLVRIVDCGATIVTLSVTERIFNRLTVGQSASFRLGGSSTVYDGTVNRLAGSGAETIYRNLAVAPSQRHLERFDVTLQVPGLRQGAGEACLIGRTGRAFFDTRPLDWLRDLFG
ncbi:MAG: HlyD family efflux transporter periplasmic adaptor subunit [Paracoccaceae bacterium]|nr:HlyD family efflux transporter periplasmic adaptor subunit [Paracoccaceae bacterium]